MLDRPFARGVTPVLGSTDRCFSLRFNGKLLMSPLPVSAPPSRTARRRGERRVRSISRGANNDSNSRPAFF